MYIVKTKKSFNNSNSQSLDIKNENHMCIYQNCSNNSPGVEIGSAQGGH